MAIAGYPATIKIGSDIVHGITTYDMPLKMDMLEDTSFSGAGASTGTHTFVPGLYGMVVKASGNWDKGDTDGQAALEAAFFARTTVGLVLSPNGTNTYSLDAWVSGYDIKPDVKGLISVDFELTMNGPVTPA
jgi:hypothetical protein